MKRAILLILGMLAALPALTQVDTKTSGFTDFWEVIKAPDYPARLTRKGYNRFLFEPGDTSTYVYTISRVKKVWPRKDTIRTSSVIENTDASIVKVNTAEGTKADVSAGNFTYVKAVGTLTSIKYPFVGDGIEVYSERYPGHGSITIFIDGVNKGTFNQGTPEPGNVYRTDFKRNAPTFSIKLPKGGHSVEIQSNAQFMLDFFKVSNYTISTR
jgi:hypothetical protein